jgi:exodeoxyribonuclease V beta subunit
MNYKAFNCLSENTLISGHKLLEASAGTGKTFAIEHITARLVLSGVSINEILIVTFTNLATKELQERIFANLEKCYFILKEKKTEGVFPYLKKYLQNESELEKAIINLQNAISFFDEAEIFTIHRFCMKTLQEHSFESCLTFLSTDFESISNKLFLQGKIKQIFLNPKLKQLFFSSSLNYFLKDKNIDALVDKILNAVNNSKCIKQKSIEEILKNVKGDFEENNFDYLNYELLWSDFLNHAKNYKIAKFSKEDFKFQIELITNLSKDFSNYKLWDQLLFQKFSIGEFFSDENLKLKFKSLEKENYPGFFSFLSKKIYPQIFQFFNSDFFLNTLVYYFKDELILQIEKTNTMSADRLLEMMEIALGNNSFKNALKKKYKAAIIDEFQDTDQIQWNIFLKAFLSEPKIKYFYLVGDPKQAIYAFRNADVYTYLDAANYLGKENKYVLDTNYRSDKTLVEGLNSLFNRRWLHLPKIATYLDYHPVKSNHKLETKTPIHYMIAEDLFDFDIETEIFFPFIADEIKKNNGPYSKYAILVKDRYQEQKLQKFLISQNIPCVCRKSSIHETHAYICLKLMMRAIFEPNDLSNLKLLMISLNYSLKDLEEEEVINYFLVTFNQLHAEFKEHGIERCFGQLVDMPFHGLTLIERLSIKENFSNSNFTDAINFLLEYSTKVHLTENSLKNFWKMIEKSNLERHSTSKDDAVLILTIHKSKGLEFDIVFCLGIAFSSSIKSLEVMSKEEIEAEKLRQLYVGLTRAKSILYIPIIISEKIKKNTSSIDYFMQNILDLKLDGKSLESILKSIHSPEQYKITFLEKRKKIAAFNQLNESQIFLENYKKQDVSRQFISFTSVNKFNHVEKKDIDCDSFPTGVHSGIIIHKILQDLFSKKSNKGDLQRHITNTLLAGFEKQIKAMLTKLLSIKLLPCSFSLKDINLAHVITEMEFCYKLAKNKMKGIIDLIFFHEERYFIVDWKTNFLGNENIDYEIKNLHKAMVDHNYIMQGVLYKNALQKSLVVFDKKPFKEIFGGVFFIFLRGIESKDNGIYHFFPSNEHIKRDFL